MTGLWSSQQTESVNRCRYRTAEMASMQVTFAISSLYRRVSRKLQSNIFVRQRFKEGDLQRSYKLIYSFIHQNTHWQRT